MVTKHKTAYMTLVEGGARGRRVGRRTLVKTWLKMAIKDVKSSIFVRMMKMSINYLPISMLHAFHNPSACENGN